MTDTSVSGRQDGELSFEPSPLRYVVMLHPDHVRRLRDEKVNLGLAVEIHESRLASQWSMGEMAAIAALGREPMVFNLINKPGAKNG